MAQKNKEKARENWRRWYYKNKAIHIARVRRHEKESRVKVRKWLDDYKMLKTCSKCGFSHPKALDFHHVDPLSKEESVSSAVTQGWSISRIKKEIEKCILLCANCHRIYHLTENLIDFQNETDLD